MIKKFNEYKMNESLDYTHVEPANESDADTGPNGVPMYIDYAEGTVDEVERALGKKVTSISGVTGETEMDYEIGLEDGSSVSIDYTFHPFKDKLDITYRTSDGGIHTKSSRDTGFEYVDAGDDVYQLLMAILKDIEPEEDEDWKWNITLPESNFDTSDTYEYDFHHHPTDGGKIWFPNEEAAKAWLDSLQIRNTNG